jgi:hypothetical protein
MLHHIHILMHDNHHDACEYEITVCDITNEGEQHRCAQVLRAKVLRNMRRSGK